MTFRLVSHTPDRCELQVSWYEDNFHPIVFERSTVPEFDWLVVGLEFTVYDWLQADPIAHATYFEKTDWSSERLSGRALPW
jgi:hypothetical protein